VGSAGVSIASPICIYPTPHNVGILVRITRVSNGLIPSAAKIRQNVFGSKHVVLPGNYTYLLSLKYAQDSNQRFIHSVFTKDTLDEQGQARDTSVHVTLQCFLTRQIILQSPRAEMSLKSPAARVLDRKKRFSKRYV